ncbi:hypothetical protein [Enterovirga sp.]|uniref:hypothetical protein n=1 Tax=Enterovirga sp. TaxID=2026350 RepID=UPI002CA8E35F|nr:hypothetical protein [Enterovirga sp.]HMO28533.1 hypothetical protein [Enterovirga sp.]
MVEGTLRTDAMRLLTPFLDDGHILRVQSTDRPRPHLIVRVRMRDPVIEEKIRDAVSSMRCRVEIALSW